MSGIEVALVLILGHTPCGDFIRCWMLNVSRQVGIHLFYISSVFSFVMCYHVINRGNNRAEIFHKDQDYLRFTEMMAEVVERQLMRILLQKKYRTPLISL